MTLSDIQRQVLVALVRARLDGDKHFLDHDELADRVGATVGDMAGTLDALSAWFAEQALPDLTAAVIPPENARHMRMLPGQSIIDRFGGEVGVRAEADRVRDFDWQGWLES